MKKVAILVLSLAVCLGNWAQATDGRLDDGAKFRCNQLLLGVQHAASDEAIFSMLDQLELEVAYLDPLLSAEEKDLVRASADDLTGRALNGGSLADLKHDFSHLIEFLSGLKAADAIDEPDSVRALMSAPDLIKAGTAYAGEGEIHQVIFDEVLVRGLEDVDQGDLIRFLRAIEKGFVPSLSGSGVLRVTDVHKRFVEVKIIGHGGDYRLVGCFEHGVLTLKKVYHRKSRGSGGALQVFHHLCL